MRKKRQDSKLGIYHIVMRGINKENIFEDNDDKNRFIQTLYRSLRAKLGNPYIAPKGSDQTFDLRCISMAHSLIIFSPQLIQR